MQPGHQHLPPSRPKASRQQGRRQEAAGALRASGCLSASSCSAAEPAGFSGRQRRRQPHGTPHRCCVMPAAMLAGVRCLPSRVGLLLLVSLCSIGGQMPQPTQHVTGDPFLPPTGLWQRTIYCPSPAPCSRVVCLLVEPWQVSYAWLVTRRLAHAACLLQLQAWQSLPPGPTPPSSVAPCQEAGPKWSQTSARSRPVLQALKP